jgi:hypothetical protein
VVRQALILTDYATFEEFLDAADGFCAEYYYVFRDGVWYCGDTYGNTAISGKLVAYDEAVELERLARVEDFEAY